MNPCLPSSELNLVNTAVVALLGRHQDLPAGTDAVETYSKLLGDALTRQDCPTTLVRLRWDEMGWPRAMRWLWQQSRAWEGQWVLVQYTALAWSRRGLPFEFLTMLYLLRRRGTRVGVVFHDPQGYPGRRLLHRARRVWQHCVMRAAYGMTDLSVLTVSLKPVPWLPKNPEKAVSIPVGSMVPAVDGTVEEAGWPARKSDEKTIAIFCVTGRTQTEEVADIAYVVQRVTQTIPRLRLLVLGGGAEDARDVLQQALASIPIQVCVLGLLPAAEVSRRLVASDALLFVRGAISGGRSSAIAAIACGLPVVAYAGPETGHPITEAGVILVPLGDRSALANQLVRVLKDSTVWTALHQRSLLAQHRYFSWDAVAARLLAKLVFEA